MSVAAPFIVNPRTDQTGQMYAATMTRTLQIMIGAILVGALIAAALVAFVAQMPILAGILLIAEPVAGWFVWRSMIKQQAARNPELVVDPSLLKGLTTSQFTTEQQLWDAAVCARDTGDTARAQMILGS